MSHHIAFALFDVNNNPLEGQTPTIITFRNAEGVDILPHPVIEEKGDGFYEFVIDLGTTGPVVYQVDCGPESATQYLTGSVGNIIAFAMYNMDGQPDEDTEPTFLAYHNSTEELPYPELIGMTGGVWAFWPTVAPGSTVYYLVGNENNKYWGTVGTTGLFNANPASGTTITNTQILSFDILDTESHLGRVLIAVYYTEWDATELAWDGTAKTGPFTITVTVIPNGKRYTIIRNGGWPSKPILRVFLTNQAGKEL